MSGRAWYQEGGCLFLVVVAAGLLGLAYQQERERRLPTVIPRLTGQIEQPFFGSPSLVITAWHQHTGVLRNGRLTIEVKGGDLGKSDGVDSQVFSFETWEPNQDRAVTMKFPLQQVRDESKLTVTCSLMARDIKPSSHGDVWLRNDWKSNQATPP
ncbi:MAG: hypothetical protein U0929_01620 [Planctomycetaceae bacterium]